MFVYHERARVAIRATWDQGRLSGKERRCQILS